MPDGAPRIRGFDYKGRYRYSLTICTFARRRVFIRPEAVDTVLLQIMRAATLHGFAVIAYCFMPDHLHLLVEGLSDDADLRRFVKDWKQRTGYAFARRHDGVRLWQIGFFDHVLRSDESTERHARYIVGNPVRAGITRTIEEYPFARVIVDGREIVDMPPRM